MNKPTVPSDVAQRRTDQAGLQQTNPSDAEELAILHQAALKQFGGSCFWDAKPSATPEGMRVVVDRLQKYGGMDAWRLASKIKGVLKHAAG